MNRGSQLQVITTNKDTEQTKAIFNRPTRIKGVKDAKRLMSRLISAFQRGVIDNRDAKDMAYLLSTYIQIHQASEFEERLEALEENQL